MSDLKPCPFCGGNSIRPASQSLLYAECQQCGAFGPGVQSVGMHIPKPCEANDLWNTRPKSEAKELLEWFSSGRVGSQIYKSANWECLFEADSFDEPYEGSGPTLLDALRAAREAMKDD